MLRAPAHQRLFHVIKSFTIFLKQISARPARTLIIVDNENEIMTRVLHHQPTVWLKKRKPILNFVHTISKRDFKFK